MSNQNNVIALTEQQATLTEQQEQFNAKKMGADLAITFNKKYASLQKAETALIDIVRKVVATDNLKTLKQFKTDVDADNSTINRYIKIAQCAFINENVAHLPKTVSVLLRIAQQIEKCDFTTALEEGILNSNMTLTELNEYIKETAESVDDGMVESVSSTQEVIESEEQSSPLLMTVNFYELFQQEGVKTRHLDELVDFLKDHCCENPLARFVWEQLRDVKLANKGDFGQIELNRREAA